MWYITITDYNGRPVNLKCKSFASKAEALAYAKYHYELGQRGKQCSTFIERMEDQS